MTLLAVDPWDLLWADVASITDLGWLLLAAFRLFVAAVLGAVIGYQRERLGKAAGLRTHILVAMGAALFVIAPLWERTIDLSRVIQGIVAGVGFIGGGAILKLSEERRIQGLTTAATIWLTAAIGIATGLGQIGMALMCSLFAVLVLELVYRLEARMGTAENPDPEDGPG